MLKTVLLQKIKPHRRVNKKGFTLMEMLIVVAIIAILIAVAIPVFSAQLHKAGSQRTGRTCGRFTPTYKRII